MVQVALFYFTVQAVTTGRYHKKGKKSKKMQRSRSMGQDNVEAAPPCFPTDDISPQRPTPPLLPGAAPFKSSRHPQPMDTTLPPSPPMDTGFPPSPPKSTGSLYDAPLRDSNSPTLTEAVMLALTPTSPRKKMKAPTPPVVPQSHAQYYEQPTAQLPPPHPPQIPSEYYGQEHNLHTHSIDDNDSPDNGISEAMADLRPKHLSPIEEMIPVELHQSPRANRHLVSKLSQSYDDIEMVGLEGAQCEMASVGNLTDDEVFHDQNPVLTTDSETETEQRKDAMAQLDFSNENVADHGENTLIDGAVLSSEFDQGGGESRLYEYPTTNTESSDMGTLQSMDTLGSDTTVTTDNTLCPTELSKSLDSILKDAGSDIYQSGSEFDNTQTDSSSRFESCTTETYSGSGNGQCSSNSDSEFRQGVRMFAETLHGYQEALAQLPTSSSEEDTLQHSMGSQPHTPTALLPALETDMDSVDMSANSPVDTMASSIG